MPSFLDWLEISDFKYFIQQRNLALFEFSSLHDLDFCGRRIRNVGLPFRPKDIKIFSKQKSNSLFKKYYSALTSDSDQSSL